MREPAADELGDFERPIQTRRTSSMLTTLASARSCCGVQSQPAFLWRVAIPDGRGGAVLQSPARAGDVRHGRFDDFEQPGKWEFKRMVANSTSLSVETASGGVTVALETATRIPGEALNNSQLGGVGISGALNVREPVARFRMNVDFANRMALNLAGVNAQDEMAAADRALSLNCCSRVKSQCA